MAKKLKLTRDEIIELLIEDELDHFIGDADYLAMSLYEGYKGFKDYTDEELIEEYRNNIEDVEVRIVELASKN